MTRILAVAGWAWLPRWLRSPLAAKACSSRSSTSSSPSEGGEDGSLVGSGSSAGTGTCDCTWLAPARFGSALVVPPLSAGGRVCALLGGGATATAAAAPGAKRVRLTSTSTSASESMSVSAPASSLAAEGEYGCRSSKICFAKAGTLHTSLTGPCTREHCVSCLTVRGRNRASLRAALYGITSTGRTSSVYLASWCRQRRSACNTWACCGGMSAVPTPRQVSVSVSVSVCGHLVALQSPLLPESASMDKCRGVASASRCRCMRFSKASRQHFRPRLRQ